jgi:amino acid transporter
VDGLPAGDPDRHDRLHRDRDGVQHGRGGKDAPATIPGAINRVRIAVYAIFFTLPAVALSALPVERDPVSGEYYTLLGRPEEEGGFAGDPILGVVKQIDLGPLQGAGELYVGPLAATILFIATSAALIGVSRLVYSMGIHRQLPDRLRQLHPRFRTSWIGILVFSAAAILTLLPGQADFRAGQAGRRIIEEATDLRAAAIVMPLPRRVAGGSLFCRTLETVLTERPCRVIIETEANGSH